MRTQEMNTEAQIDQIEINIDQAKFKIKRMAKFKRLADSQDFKDIIEDDYFIKHASRLVLLRATPAMQEDFAQRDIDNDIIAIGHLRQYFVGIMQEGQSAERALSADEQTLEELNKEALEA